MRFVIAVHVTSIKLTNLIQTAFIEQLQRQAYEYLDIKDEAGLIANLRRQIKRLNNVKFSDGDWDRFFRNEIAKETGRYWKNKEDSG